MKCFYHDDRDAVGVCKSCQKAVCRECAVDLGKGIACRNRCEEDVRQLIELVDRNVRYQPATTDLLARARTGRIGAVIFYIVLGAAFICWGLLTPHLHFISFMGIVFVLYGCFAASQLPKKSVETSPQKSNHEA